MPYVTKISTPNRSKSGLKDNNIRSASGKYSIMYAASESAATYHQLFVAVDGFNLNPDDDGVRVVSSTAVTSTSTPQASFGEELTSTLTDEKGEETTAQTGYKKFCIENIIPKSGYLEVFTNGVRTLNNLNKTDAHDANGEGRGIGSAISDWENYYNREPDYYTTKNVQLTDDRYLIMWDMHKTNTKNGYYPVMIMDKDSNNNDVPVFGYVDSSGRHSADSSVSMYRATDMQPQRRKFNADGSYTSLNTEYLVSGTTWDQMAMAKDDAGKYHHVSVYNRASCSMGYYYESFARLYTKSGGYDGRQMGVGYQNYTPEWSQNGSNNALTLDAIDAGGAMVDRYQGIKLLATGKSTTTTGATVYQSYYDDKTGELIFRNFKVASKTPSATAVNGQNNISFTYQASVNGFLYNNATGAGTNRSNNYVLIDDVYYTITRERATGNVTINGSSVYRPYYYIVNNYSGTTNFTSTIYSAVTYTTPAGWYDMYGNICTNFDENDDDESYADGRNVVATGASKFYDFGISGSRAVFVYYDFAEGRLRLMYSNSDITGNPSTAVNFTENGVRFPDYVGQYVSMAIDGAGHIHIAAFDSNDSDLKYIYLDSYSAGSFTEMTVDAAGSVGNWTSIKVDKTEGHTYYNTPIIAYYNATETGGHDAIKLAISKNAAGSVTAGIDSTTEYTSTGWEYMTIPSVDPAQGGSQKFQQVCLDFDSSGNPVVGYLGTNLEFGKQRSE